MFRRLFFILCSVVPFIWCELARNDIEISSPSIAGGLIPSESISLSTSTGTEFSSRGKEEMKTQDLTLKTPFITVSVKNATAPSPEDDGNGITSFLQKAVDKSEHDLLPDPENLADPEDIMLDLNIPMKVKELEDLAKVSSVEQFKQKVLRSSLIEKLYSSALGKMPLNFLSKRRKRAIISQPFHANIKPSYREVVNDEHLVQKQRPNPNPIYYHPRKKSPHSEFVYEPETTRGKFRRNANTGGWFNPSMRSDIVGVVHIPHPVHHIPHLIPPPLIRAPIIPHRPVHHVPRLVPPPPLPVIPPHLLAQIIRARARHPLPPLIPIGLLPQIARSVGILPSQILPSLINSYSSYPASTEDLIILRGNPNLQHNVVGLRNIPQGYLPLSQYQISPLTRQLQFSDYPGRRIVSLMHSPALPQYAVGMQQGAQKIFPVQSDHFKLHPVYGPDLFTRSIFEQIPPFRRSDKPRSSSSTPYVPRGFFDSSTSSLPYQQKMIRYEHAGNRPALMNPINHQFLMPMPTMDNTRIRRKIPLHSNADSQEVMESLEQTGTLLGNTFFSFLNHMPTITR